MTNVQWSWADFPPGDRDEEAMRLPRTGWLALVAFLAGPRSVSFVKQPPAEVRWRSGSAAAGTRDLSREEVEEAESELAMDLELAGVDAPPPGIEWRLRLPAGVSEEEFGRLVNDQMAPDGYHEGNARATAERLQRELSQLLGGLG